MTHESTRPWYTQDGPHGDLVISSRIRLARNLQEFPFPNRLSDRELERVCRAVSGRFFQANAHMRDSFREIRLAELSETEAEARVEKHLISEELLERRNCTRLLLSDDEHLSIMLGEEDHIRIQSLHAGLNLKGAFEDAVKLARMFEELVPIAWHDQYGFLTACPTNTGTGMRASLMVHLPLLTETRLISGTVESLRKLGIAVRGAYGEHSKPLGDIYQISNQMTLGFSEEDLIADLMRATTRVLAHEKNLRRALYRKQPLLVEDRVYRALAVLGSSRMMSREEALRLMSDVRLGLDLEVIGPDLVRASTLNHLTATVGPAAIAADLGIGDGERAGVIARATYIRERLGEEVADDAEDTAG